MTGEETNSLFSMNKFRIDRFQGMTRHPSWDIPDTVGNSGLTFGEIRSKLSGLHFSKESLTRGEREILLLAEALLDELHKIYDI